MRVLVWAGLALLASASRAESVISPKACSSYMGSAVLNEIRIGSSGKSSTSNQVEIFNLENIDPAIWKTWQLVVYYMDSRGSVSKKGGYYLSSGFTANGQFIFNDGRNLTLRNRANRSNDFALVDRFGYLIDYLAIEKKIQTPPACFSGVKIVDATASRNTSGNVSRVKDGGDWPGSVSNTTSHTIGRSNACSLTGKDLTVTSNVDIVTPIVNDTQVTFTLNVSNKSCSSSISDIVLTDSTLSTDNFSSLGTSGGSASVGVGGLVWKIGTLAAGASSTLSVTGKPRRLGEIVTKSAITSPTSGLINTGDDVDSEILNVRDFNYVGFDLDSAELTEGTDTDYTVTITSDVQAEKPITIKYSVSGSADGGDTNLPASGSITIDPSDDEAPTEASIDFTISNDATYEPAKTIILRITGLSSSDATVRLDSARQEMKLTLADDDPAFIAPGGFNAFETTTAAGAIAGVIKTKIAGQAFSLDISAINTAATGVLTAFTGDVAVELVNAASGSACADFASVGSAGTASFASADNGRRRIGISHNEAWPNLRLRMKYPAVGAASVTACSSDNFAIRPASLVGIAKDADWAAAGTTRTLNGASATAAPLHKAGQPFSLIATAYNVGGTITSGYNGNPVVSQTSCVLPSSGCITGTLSSGTFTGGSGTRTSSTASYSEAGAISVTLSDAGFAAVDASDGSSTAERTLTSAAFNIGRFVPDHFDISVNSPVFTPGCGSFTYLGQPFGLGVAPVWRITARNSAGATTRNYSGALFKITPATVTGQTWSAAEGALAAPGGLPTVGVSDLGDGIGSLAFGVGDPAGGGGLLFARASQTAPFNASLSLAASVGDSDGVTHVGNPYMHSAIGFDDGNVATTHDAAIYFGRLRLANAAGAETRPLPIPLSAQIWNGQGFVLNSADNCTALTAPSLAYFSQTADNRLASGETTASFNNPLIGGDANLRLSAPGAANFGYLDLAAGAPSWLRYNWDGVDQAGDGNLFDDNPRARAAFGKRGGSDRVIIRREVF
jgi:hypothetical protein